ncbi:glutamate-5-semialdehyde dehydrogenase [Luteibaculum oceani]|uniref:Gamma-glutamyl phosphate reductase n=1 Tax=Luteibaculum oceani TaxID=1294296 RepID=A0A5C6VB37_9FLAO|nr:glutamate-5-semialdehyde dehydrogenase [Luteibaculum oceani]TXC82104.1 glutamate-5-semialdehyde dehydrogenase [Luteibaculum oceani]
MKILNTETKNKVLASMERIIDAKREEILAANKLDLEAFSKDDQALYDRLVVDDRKINGMIQAVAEVRSQEDPVGKVISERKLDNGLTITNKTAPFGTILIIYESRPDVTIEAAVLAFKANSKILLKGGKEAINSNKVLVDCWHEALEENGLSKDWITLFTLNRQETQEFLRNPSEKLDLIVPRGGERLIAFVKEHAQCAVLVSGRGNNFAYVAEDSDWEMAKKVIINAKTNKISGCNALDKILVDKKLPHRAEKLKDLENEFRNYQVELLADKESLNFLDHAKEIEDRDVWYEEFLALKAVVGQVNGLEEAVDKINTFSGGHSATILTSDTEKAAAFMEKVDAAAVYHNASTRFTDGGQMGVGAELAISTDKLHHRGPLGLEQLVTNKYYVFGNGQIRD